MDMIDNFIWEFLSETTKCRISRCKIEGGYLYETFNYPSAQICICFVPTIQTWQKYMDELQKNDAKIDDLQERLDDQNTSDMKAWYALVNRIDKLEIEYSKEINHRNRICEDYLKRIERLEESLVNAVDHENCNAYRILKLENIIASNIQNNLPHGTHGKNAPIYHKKECDHEWFPHVLTSMPPQKQCRKCGITKIVSYDAQGIPL